MANVSVAAEWLVLIDRYHRKSQIYEMKWKFMDIAKDKVAGPIAVIRDDAKIVQLRAESAQRKRRIFNSAGGRLVGLFWTDDQTLACVVLDGTVYRYNLHAQPLDSPTLSLGRECFEENVVYCVFWGNGVVCFTEAGRLSAIPDFRARCLADTEAAEGELPNCMAVIEPQYTVSGNVEVVLGMGDGILVVDEDEVRQIGEEGMIVQRIVVSQHGRFHACFLHDGRLVVMNNSFEFLFQFQCESALSPRQMAWCGLDSMLLYWKNDDEEDEDTLLMVGPSEQDSVRYVYDEPIFLILECDGVRILSNTRMEFLQRVPDSTVSIFRIGSTSPASLLFDALDHFDRRSAKADENLRLIRSSLPAAVDACVDAAGHEFDINRQQTLRAASYGQAFCSNTRNVMEY